MMVSVDSKHWVCNSGSWRRNTALTAPVRNRELGRLITRPISITAHSICSSCHHSNLSAMLQRIFKSKGKDKNKGSNTSVPATVPEFGGQAVNDAHNVAMDQDNEHYQSSDEEGSESTSLEYFPTAEENQQEVDSRTKGSIKASLKLTFNMVESSFVL
ncbi:hypothetical protein M378DRAFT_634520 [Amanita muscaria Koide BX008]|uniref:Uncharacterized protein n=1 Tax=Amanita muscaria (strain Koide BX008) TaxID=946122 RepID=A0A0C2RYF9_AMAMK|nr:hypothetical protein M378DRAFT_634520 [Amanita muscaria Koide BX008]